MSKAYKAYPCAPCSGGQDNIHKGRPLPYGDDDYYPPYAKRGTQTSDYSEDRLVLRDYGPEPIAFNIEKATLQNNAFRTAFWTGDHLQLTLMSIRPGEDIGLERHPNLDQFIRIEEGQGLVLMGDSMNYLDYRRRVGDDFAIIIPAGKWHNLINTGNTPLKLYSIYAPPQHPFGTVHRTKAEAMAAEESH